MPMTIQLPENLENSIREAVRGGQFASVDDAMAEATRLLLNQLKNGQLAPTVPLSRNDNSGPLQKPFWEDIVDIAAKIPDAVLDKLPTDGAEQHDHFIYGTPKRTPAP